MREVNKTTNHQKAFDKSSELLFLYLVEIAIQQINHVFSLILTVTVFKAASHILFH